MAGVNEREQRAAVQADRLLGLLGDRDALSAFMNRLDRTDLAWLVLAFAADYARIEGENGDLHVRVGILTRQCEQFDIANAALFRERRELTARVSELRGIVYTRGKKAA